MNIRRLSLLFLVSALFSAQGLAASPEEHQVVAIISPSYNPGPVSRNLLRAIFVMRLAKWNDGTPIKVYVFDDSSPTHESFSKEILQFFPRQLRQAWDRQVFSGLGQYPQQVESVQEMLDKIQSTPGSIGYITKDEVNENVRILQISP